MHTSLTANTHDYQLTNVYFGFQRGNSVSDEIDYVKRECNFSNRPFEEINFPANRLLITSLNLSNVSDLIPECLKNFKFLEFLNLSSTFIDTKSLKFLPRKCLSTLILRNCKNLKHLSTSFKNFKQLECLDLSRSSIDNKSLENLPSSLSSLALNQCKLIRNLPATMKHLEHMRVLQLIIPKLSFESLDNIPTKSLEKLSFHHDSTYSWGTNFDNFISAMYYGITKHSESGWFVKTNKNFVENVFDSPALRTRVEMYVKNLFNNSRVYFGDDDVLIFDMSKAAFYR